MKERAGRLVETRPACVSACLPALAAFTTTTAAATAAATAATTAAAATPAAAATTTAATATAAAAAATTTEATPATATRCALLGLIHDESAPIEFGVVHLLDRVLRGCFFLEGYEAETA